MVVTKTHKDIKPVLMDSTKKGVKYPYYQILGDGQIIFVVSPGFNGPEYNKTTVFFNNYPSIQVYQCLSGQGMILMQRMDQQGEAKEFKVISIPVGLSVTVPIGWVTCLVNVGKSLLVVLANIGIESNLLDSKEAIEKKGLIYYVVEKKGEISFEQNPNYSVYPQISTE